MPVLYVIICAAGVAGDVGCLVEMAQNEGWAVQVVATPSALDFIDVPALEKQTGRSVRSTYRKPNEPKSPRADAIVVAPATFNTINKFAQGITDSYALGVMAEAPGLGIPLVVLPAVNSALAARVPFRAAVESLRAEGVHVVRTPEGAGAFPWHLALAALQRSNGRP
ncbi:MULTISPECIES: flavoprotein [Nonomuraea]|uniref:Flavoprotein n=1 Tax=Nonomuraea mangrovi TaxID=2316207 RepID=A0ABW4TEL6_9ACTN